MCRAVFKFQGELLQGQCLHAQAHGPRQRRGEIPPQPTSADKPMSNGTWRQDQLPAAALAARRPIRIEGSASAQAVKAQWLCTCYTWPGSNWRPSACEADVIATRPQVLLKVELLQIHNNSKRQQRSPNCVAFAFVVSAVRLPGASCTPLRRGGSQARCRTVAALRRRVQRQRLPVCSVVVGSRDCVFTVFVGSRVLKYSRACVCVCVVVCGCVRWCAVVRGWP